MPVQILIRPKSRTLNPSSTIKASRTSKAPKKLKVVDIRRKAKAILAEVGLEDRELSLLYTDDPEMAKLNFEYRGREGPTDVLSFSQIEGEFGDMDDSVLGDVVISVDTARKQAEVAGHSIEKELDILLTHGILHLAGYDHEKGPAQARKMKALERKIIELLDV
jgi:rRNA maturation RNase YbeY